MAELKYQKQLFKSKFMLGFFRSECYYEKPYARKSHVRICEGIVIIMHALSNLFGSVITQTLMSVSMIAAGLYSMFLILLGIIGFILFFVNKKKIILDKEKGLFRKTVSKDLLTNKGIWYNNMKGESCR